MTPAKRRPIQLPVGLLERLIAAIGPLIDQAVRLSPLAQKHIRELKDCSLFLSFPIANLRVSSTGERLLVTAADTLAPDECGLSATPLTLLRLLTQNKPDSLLASWEIQSAGHQDLLLKWVALAQELDIDWEAFMAEHLGDVPAHMVGQALRRSRKWGQHLNTSLLSNIEEYLHEEARLLPTRVEVEYQRECIENLTDRLDDLDARLEQLERRLPRKPGDQGSQTKP